MSDITEVKLERAKQIVVEQFITGMVTGSKTIGLYREGHPIIMQICERSVSLLANALGQDTTLTFEVKAKRLLVNDAELPETADINALASTLHTLGVGQVLFTNRLAKEGMYEFFKILIWKADEKTSLSDIQKAVQQLRIDGLQMVFVLSFVVTGEQATADQPPGRLTEEQILAFIQARTLPDLLYLMLKQNEPLTGKEAETVTMVLDDALNRALSMEKLAEQMPWAQYDPRIKARFDEFAAALRWEPRPRGAGARGAAKPRDRWDAARAVSASSLFLDSDVAAFQDHGAHEKGAGMSHALERVHALIEHPQGQHQPKFAMQSYTRLLLELSRDGDVPGLLREFDFQQSLQGRPELQEALAQLSSAMQERLATAPFAARLVERLGFIEQNSEEFGKITALLLFLGSEAIPLLLEELRRLADKHTRAKLSALITTICLRWGAKPLLDALKDDDYFLVSQVALILGNLGSGEFIKPLIPHLRHKHERVREAARRVLARLGGEEARDAIGAFMLSAEDEEEAKQAVTALTLMSVAGVDSKLVEAFQVITDYEIRVHIAAAMGRVHSPAVEEVLSKAARRNLWERITGRNKELAEAAQKSLEEIAEDKKKHPS